MRTSLVAFASPAVLATFPRRPWIKGEKAHSVRCEAECVQAIDVRGKWDAISDAKTQPAAGRQ